MLPGLWEITTTARSAGIPDTPARIVLICITQKDLDSTKGGVPGDKILEHCGISDYRLESGRGSWNFSCDGEPAMKGSGSIRYMNDAFTQTTSMTLGSDLHMTATASGRRTGDCNK